jgi:GxxExxY protein
VLEHRDLTERIIGLAIEVHRTIGPGLLESVYEACLCLELKRAGVQFRRQVSMPVVYKGTLITRVPGRYSGRGYRYIYT